MTTKQEMILNLGDYNLREYNTKIKINIKTTDDVYEGVDNLRMIKGNGYEVKIMNIDNLELNVEYNEEFYNDVCNNQTADYYPIACYKGKIYKCCGYELWFDDEDNEYNYHTHIRGLWNIDNFYNNIDKKYHSSIYTFAIELQKMGIDNFILYM